MSEEEQIKQIERAITEIIGYSCETQAPNSQPNTEFITDRWMKARRDALVQYVLHSKHDGWDEGWWARVGDGPVWSENPYPAPPKKTESTPLGACEHPVAGQATS